MCQRKIVVRSTYRNHRLFIFLHTNFNVLCTLSEFEDLKQNPEAIKNIATWNKYMKCVNSILQCPPTIMIITTPFIISIFVSRFSFIQFSYLILIFLKTNNEHIYKISSSIKYPIVILLI